MKLQAQQLRVSIGIVDPNLVVFLGCGFKGEV